MIQLMCLHKQDGFDIKLFRVKKMCSIYHNGIQELLMWFTLTSSVLADESWLWALLRTSLAALPSKFSTGCASSAIICNESNNYNKTIHLMLTNI